MLPLDGAALGVLAGVAVAMVLALLLARFLAARPDPSLTRPEGPGAGGGAGRGGQRRGAALWLANPFAGLLVVPAAHLWLLVLVSRVQPNRRVRAACCWRSGRCPALLVAVYYLFALSIGPARRRLVPAAAGDRAHRRAADGAGGLRDAGRAVRRGRADRRSPAAPPELPAEPGPRALGPGFALRR